MLFYQNLYLGLALTTLIPTVVPILTTSVQAQETETIIHVNPESDNEDRATGEQPYQTLTEALAAASRNAVIQLAPGTYSEETGEQFPIVVRKNVEIRGTPDNQGQEVKIEGGGLFRSPTGAGQHVAIALLADATLTGVSVTNQRDRGHGVWVEGANPTVTHNTFRNNDSTGLSVNGFGQPRISENYFNSNAGNGMVIYGRSEPIIENNTFENTGFGISITEQTKPQLLENEVKNNRIGIVIEGNAQPILRNNTITRSREQGLVAISNSRPDLGTDEAPGGNIFRRNGKGAINNSTKNFVIPANGNEIVGSTEGEIDLTGTVANPMPEEEESRPRLQIVKPKRTPPSNPSSSQEQVWTAPSAESSSTLSTDSNTPPLRVDGDIPTPVSSSQLVPPENNGSSSNAVRGDIQLSTPPNRSSNNDTASNNSPSNPPSTSNSQTPNNPPPSPRSGGRSSLDEILALHSNSSQGSANTSRNNSPAQRNPNSLPVPNADIPSGNQFPPGTSPEERAASVGGEYRVIVEISGNSDRDQVKAVVPDAFSSRYQGRSVMQVGIFQSPENAEEIEQKLRQEGLQVRVIPMNNN